VSVSKLDELNGRIAEVERNLIILKRELARVSPDRSGYAQLKAIVDFSEVRLDQMLRERDKQL
jgi:hypothetical protein